MKVFSPKSWIQPLSEAEITTNRQAMTPLIAGYWTLILLVLIATVGLGTYTRIKDAGLGCPDWPTCFGYILPPSDETLIAQAEAEYDVGYTPEKIFWEVFHRFIASSLGLLLILGTIIGYYRLRWTSFTKVAATTTALVTLQGILGYWTVSLKLMPLTVTSHMLLGFTIMAIVVWNMSTAIKDFLKIEFAEVTEDFKVLSEQQELRVAGQLTGLAGSSYFHVSVLLVCVCQALLGAWVSSQYAQYACPEFPSCDVYGMYIPSSWHLDEVFNVNFIVGLNYEGGRLSEGARIALHLLHRYFALFVAAVVLWQAYLLARSERIAFATFMIGIVAIQVALGIVNVVQAFPSDLRLYHSTGAWWLIAGQVFLLQHVREAVRVTKEDYGIVVPTIYDYIDLTKPRVLMLLLITAAMGGSLAITDEHNPLLLVFIVVGIGFMAAAAAVLNQVFESDIDKKMSRTEQRPTATGVVPLFDAKIYAAVLILAGTVLLWAFGNTLTMLLALGTLLAYSYFYTLYLKPATSQNIVIGGVSGAAPPMLAWVGVTGELSAEPLMLMAIIYCWTPAHFWALAIDRIEDYKKSGYPMLPVTHGIDFTQLQILLYAILTVLCSLIFFAISGLGMLYLSTALVIGGYFVWRAWKLYTTDDENPMGVFVVSNWYLMLLFVSMVIDKWLI